MRFLIYALKIEVTFILEMLCYVNMSTEPQLDIRKDSRNVSHSYGLPAGEITHFLSIRPVLLRLLCFS